MIRQCKKSLIFNPTFMFNEEKILVLNVRLNKAKLSQKIAKISGLISVLSNKERFFPEFTVWEKETVRLLVSIFWEASYQVKDFKSIDYSVVVYYAGMPENDLDIKYRKWLHEALLLLEWFLNDLSEDSDVWLYSDFWQLFNSKIIEVSKKLFDDWHYASAVFEATKLVNNEIKELVKKATGQEFDWTDLMNRAFSVKTPIILLWDLSNETGRNMQQWYMDIYRWTMSAIRNPKWHENIQIDKKKAIHFLFLANLLLLKMEDQVNL